MASGLCESCRRSRDTRVYRGARFILIICDSCALKYPVIDATYRELRVTAVAVEAFYPE